MEADGARPHRRRLAEPHRRPLGRDRCEADPGRRRQVVDPGARGELGGGDLLRPLRLRDLAGRTAPATTSARATASSTPRGPRRTPCAPARTASRCSPSASATPGAGRGCRGQASPGVSAPGFAPGSRTSIRGSSRRRPASPSFRSRWSGRPGSSTPTTSRRSPFGRGSVSSVARDLGRAAGSVRTGLNLVTRARGQAQRAAALPLRRGGALRRPRRGRRARADADPVDMARCRDRHASPSAPARRSRGRPAVGRRTASAPERAA